MKAFLHIVSFFIMSIQLSYTQVDFSEDWYCSNWKWEKEDDSIADFTEIITNKYNFSNLFMSHYPNSYGLDNPTPIHGVFGKGYDKIDIFFTRVSQSKEDFSKYTVTGKSKLFNNICDFDGQLNITSVLAYFPKKRTDTILVVKGNYYLNEHQEKKGAGYFKGAFKIILWARNMHSKKISFDMDATYEGGAVKAFVGIWKKHNSENPAKLCIWGFDRFPEKYTSDFDIGDGETVINIKYAKTWFNYTDEEWQKIEEQNNKGLNIHFHKYISPSKIFWHKEK